jgi:hypothetical protein
MRDDGELIAVVPSHDIQCHTSMDYEVVAAIVIYKMALGFNFLSTPPNATNPLVVNV